MRRITNGVLERNGGLHRSRALARVLSMLEGHGFARPRLYHLVVLDHAAESSCSVQRFQGVIKGLCRMLRGEGIPVRWRAAIERDDEKGLHCHVFFLVNDVGMINPCKIFNAKRYGPQALLGGMLAKRFMDFYLAPPQNPIHRVGGTREGDRVNYATLAGPKLDDCKEWVSYLVKTRSKPDDLRTIYLSSRDSKYPPGTIPPTAKKRKTDERRSNQYRRVRPRARAPGASGAVGSGRGPDDQAAQEAAERPGQG
jgi:hypothetical protein